VVMRAVGHPNGRDFDLVMDPDQAEGMSQALTRAAERAREEIEKLDGAARHATRCELETQPPGRRVLACQPCLTTLQGYCEKWLYERLAGGTPRSRAASTGCATVVFS
jgi:hypothetical protein